MSVAPETAAPEGNPAGTQAVVIEHSPDHIDDPSDQISSQKHRRC